MQSINFTKLNGLVPAVIQDAATDRVLMVGFMNEEALTATRDNGLVTFYSRTRNQLWTKGETSNNFLRVKDILVDCDGDTLLIKALPDGPTCHTGADTCFDERNDESLNFLRALEALIDSRREADPGSSYTAKLLSSDIKRVAKKVGEEGVEVAIEATNPDQERFLDECADLIYHLQVLLAHRNLKLADVAQVLRSRHGEALRGK